MWDVFFVPTVYLPLLFLCGNAESSPAVPIPHDAAERAIENDTARDAANDVNITPPIPLFDPIAALKPAVMKSQIATALKPYPDGEIPLSGILRRWSDASRLRRPFTQDLYYFSYDMAFDVESRGKGTLRYRRPNYFDLDIYPAEIEHGASSTRSDRNGKPFQLRPASRRSMWTFQGKELMLGNRNSSIPIAEFHKSNPRIAEYPTLFSGHSRATPVLLIVPLFVDLSEAELNDLYDWKIVRQGHNSAQLSATIPPKWGRIWREYRYQVILDKCIWQVRAIQIEQPGRKEVYTYYNARELSGPE